MNTIVSVASLATATAVTSPALGSGDPMFAAIEIHKRAFVEHLKAQRDLAYGEDASPQISARKHAQLRRADRKAYDAYSSASAELAALRPTTLAGVSALLDHVERFNAGEFGLADDSKGWRSGVTMWPGNRLCDDDSKDVFPHGLWANVRTSLADMPGAFARAPG